MNSAHIIQARNVNGALEDGLWTLATTGRVTATRNGPALVAPGPVITHYTHPTERVMFSQLRDANPFFHLYECVWMMAGRSDAVSVARYARTMDVFANSAGDLTGAYGKRWRTHFGFDQVDAVIELLRSEPNTRRAVIQMWDPTHDLATAGTSKDVPCNTAVYFTVKDGSLQMTVTNRSNDAVWGAYGANSVHMSFLQEFIAHAVGVPVGSYYQFSNDFHVYIDRPDVARLIEANGYGSYNVLYEADDRYSRAVAPTDYPLNHGGFNYRRFRDECDFLAEHPCDATVGHHDFLYHVFSPMMRAHREYRYGDYQGAYNALKACRAQDWRQAGNEWLTLRILKKAEVPQ